MRLSTIILPIYSWRDGRAVWRRAEQLGFHGAYTYDHLSWRTFRDGPWFGTMPTLTAAATATETIRLGTMVTNPNFRHPLTLAKDLMTLDDISGGRITLGIGAGGSGFDATVLGNAQWSPRERADRFGEFLPLLSTLLQQDVTTSTAATTPSSRRETSLVASRSRAFRSTLRRRVLAGFVSRRSTGKAGPPTSTRRASATFQSTTACASSRLDWRNSPRRATPQAEM